MVFNPGQKFHEMTGEKQSEKKYRKNDLHLGKTVVYRPGADDLSQRNGRKVITGKNITI